MKLSDKGMPLILVFYIDREMLMQPDFREAYLKNVNDAIEQRDSNIITFFLPTDGEDRIDCINPMTIDDVDHADVAQLVNDLRKDFGF